MCFGNIHLKPHLFMMVSTSGSVTWLIGEYMYNTRF